VEPNVKTAQDYVTEVANRFGQLNREEAESLLNLYGTPQLMTISKVLGPEVSSVLGEVMDQIARATVSPSQEQTPAQEAPMPMSKGGLVSRRKKPVAKRK